MNDKQILVEFLLAIKTKHCQVKETKHERQYTL